MPLCLMCLTCGNFILFIVYLDLLYQFIWSFWFLSKWAFDGKKLVLQMFPKISIITLPPKCACFCLNILSEPNHSHEHEMKDTIYNQIILSLNSPPSPLNYASNSWYYSAMQIPKCHGSDSTQLYFLLNWPLQNKKICINFNFTIDFMAQEIQQYKVKKNSSFKNFYGRIYD